jgi:hypothetical protein
VQLLLFITFYDFPKLSLALWERGGVRELPCSLSMLRGDALTPAPCMVRLVYALRDAYEMSE